MLKINRPTSGDFLAGGREMGALTRAYCVGLADAHGPTPGTSPVQTALRILNTYARVNAPISPPPARKSPEVVD